MKTKPMTTPDNMPGYPVTETEPERNTWVLVDATPNYPGAHQEWEIGDRVKWESQAGGVWKTKYGEVVDVIKPGQFVMWQDYEHLGRRGFAGGSRRNHYRYVVAVRTGKTDKAMPMIHLPVTSQLRKP